MIGRFGDSRSHEKMEIDKNQTLQLNQINDFIRDIHNNDVDLSLNEEKKSITIPNNFEEWEFSNFEEFKFFKEIKSLLTKPFEIWYTFEIDGEWFINFLLYDGELFWSYQTDDINDFILILDEFSDDYDDERGEILARINEGILDDDNYPLLPKSADKGEYKPEEYSLLK